MSNYFINITFKKYFNYSKNSANFSEEKNTKKEFYLIKKIDKYKFQKVK